MDDNEGLNTAGPQVFSTKSKPNRRKFQLSAFVLIFAIIGGVYLVLSHALSQTTTIKSSAVAVAQQTQPSNSFANPQTFATKGSTSITNDAQRSYLKFTVSGISGNVTKATLRLYSTNSSSNGYSVKQILDNSWDPSTLSYSTAPPVGNLINRSAALTANTWSSVDVSSYVTTNGTYSFAIWPNDTILATFSNSGDTTPQLVIESGSITDTSSPTNVYVVNPKSGATVKGTVYFDGGASDNVGVTKYEYFADNQSIGTAPATPYGYIIYNTATKTFGYDSTKLADGTHTIYSVASDAAGNSTKSAPITITVQNNVVPPPGSGPVRAVFYYPWFPETWGSNISSPFTNYHPTLGFYNSDDQTVINKQVNMMTYAGLDAGIASWWGQGTHNEATRIPELLNSPSNNSNNKNFKWSLYYEKEGVGDPSVSEIAGDLSYIKTKYAANPNYLKINDKPVIFVYGDGGDTCATADRWKQANAGEGFYVVLKVFANFTTCSSQPDGWHQYGPASATDSQGQYSYTISPGFWKKGEATPRLNRLDASTWAANINNMIKSQAQFQLITTFNEWGEGTAIEPANSLVNGAAGGWASASGYGTYIDVLHQILNNTGTDVTPPTIPTNLTVVPPLNQKTAAIALSWGASTDSGSGLKGYEIFRNNGTTALVTVTSTTYTDTTVQAGTSYSYYVKAVDNAGNLSNASNTVTATPTPPPPTDTTPPSVPGSFRASLPVSTSKTVHLSWSASTDNVGGSGMKGYLVSRNGILVAAINNGSTISFDDTTTNFATQYTYAISAIDNANNTSAAATASITTPQPLQNDTQAPDVPSARASAVSPTQVTISWNAVADNPKNGSASGVKGYRVLRDGTQVADVAAPSTSTNDSFNFTVNQSYSYTVLAYDVAGNASAKSAPSSVVPNPQISSGANCGNAPTGNKIDTVIVISEENRSWGSVGGPGFSASQMPYTHAVASRCAFFQQDTEVDTNDNSATQYLGAWMGFGPSVSHVSHDCSPSSSCSYTGNNIFRVFRNAGIPHREYVEGASGPCSASGNAAKHIPDLYMWDPTDRANCNNEVRPMSEFSFANPPTGYTFITPTLCNDGHDCGNNTVDSWLSNSSRLPALFNSTSYKSGKVLVELWWDEDHPKPNLFACWSCKQVNSSTDPKYSGESLLWLNLLGAPSGNLGGISSGPDIRSIIGTP